MRYASRCLQILLALLLLIPAVAVWPASAYMTTPVATPGGSTPVTDAPELTPDTLLQYAPNELGVIPVFMYHNIVDDPTLEGHLYRTYDELYNDMQWLYDRDFYLIGMQDLVSGIIDIPIGKHPVVLTFDDSSSMHLSFQIGDDGQPLKDENGEYIPTPNCAVGIIEQFAKDHPDFGKTAHFAVIPAFKFSWPEYEQDDLAQAKLQWLLDHGYEIGNHTGDHADLAQATLEDFARSIAEPVIWTQGRVDPNSPGYAMDILTLPYGAYPEGGWDGDKLEYLKNGSVWDGVEIHISAALLVCCGPSPNRFSNDWARFWIPRIRGDDPDYAKFDAQINGGEFVLYTSDGNPTTFTVPWPLPQQQWGEVDWDAVKASGLKVVRYEPDTGRILPERQRKRANGYTWESADR